MKSFDFASQFRIIAASTVEVLLTLFCILYLNRFEKDLVEAHKWYNIAAARGNKDAVQRRNKLSKKMQRPDINRAQQMARSWKPKKEKPN